MVELKLPLTAETYHFVGRKPTAVVFGEERIEVKNWRQVFSVILSRSNLQCHERLILLPNKDIDKRGKIRYNKQW
jgi:hypothetical protein